MCLCNAYPSSPPAKAARVNYTIIPLCLLWMTNCVLPGVGAVDIVNTGTALHSVAVGSKLRGYINLDIGRAMTVVAFLIVTCKDSAVVRIAAGNSQRAVAHELNSRCGVKVCINSTITFGVDAVCAIYVVNYCCPIKIGID